MKKFFLPLLLCAVAWATANAVPAKRGVHVFTQSDGSQVSVELVGDEWHHSYVTQDGLTVMQAENGDFYYRTTDGMSKVRVHNMLERTDSEKKFIESNSQKMSMQALYNADTQAQARRARNNAARKASQVPNTGSPRIPVVLVQYKDKKFIDSDPKAAWEKQITGVNEVSVYQYFVDQSFGKYTPPIRHPGPSHLGQQPFYLWWQRQKWRRRGSGHDGCRGLPGS